MQGIATWLVARPINAVLGLVISLLLPGSPLTSGAILVLLLLAQHKRLALIEAMIAAAVLAAVALILEESLSSTVALLAGIWIPVTLLATLLIATRSLILTLQVSVIFALLTMIGFQIVVTDVAAFWEPYLATWSEFASQNGLQLDIESISVNALSVSAIVVFWMLYSAGLLIGYWLYRRLPVETENFGRFRELNLGRVIAFTLALASSLALVIDATWLQNFAFVLFAAFMMQGLAIAHWLRAAKGLPVVVLVSVYVLVLVPVLQALPAIVLALIGYLDAWFDIRRRIGKA